ncbi:transposable element Tc1 transposase [Trichonephila clavipes]|nr:transposable element Tc1 transposase [Trichonephila clavipes]
MTKETSEIQFVTHNRVSAHTIRRHLRMSGMSARRSLLCLIITGNHMSLRRKWCDEQGVWTTEWYGIVFTDESRFYLQHHEGQIRVRRLRDERPLHCCDMHHHTGLSCFRVVLYFTAPAL